MIHSLKAFDGELEIDHRCSPGMTVADVPHAEFHRAPIVGEGQRLECGTYSCTHCQAVVIMNPMRVRDRKYCPYCDHYICENPVCVMMSNGTLKHRTMRQLFDELLAEALRAAAIHEV